MPRACRGGGARTGLGPCVGASAGCSSVTTAAMCRVADVNEPLLAQREVSLPPVTERGVDPGGQFLIRSEARHSLPPRHLDRFGPEQATAGSRHVIILLGVQQLFGGRGARAARIAAVGLGRAARRAGPDAGRAATRSYSPAASRSNTLAPSSCTARSAAGGGTGRTPIEPTNGREHSLEVLLVGGSHHLAARPEMYRPPTHLEQSSELVPREPTAPPQLRDRRAGIVGRADRRADRRA